MRADKRVAALETELETTRNELAAVAAEGMAKEEEMREMKKKFAQVMDKMGGLQMGTTEATAGEAGEGAMVAGGEGGHPVATPALPPMGKKPAGVGSHARQFDLPNAEEIHKYAVHLGIDPMADREFLWLAEEVRPRRGGVARARAAAGGCCPATPAVALALSLSRALLPCSALHCTAL